MWYLVIAFIALTIMVAMNVLEGGDGFDLAACFVIATFWPIALAALLLITPGYLIGLWLKKRG